MPTHTITGTPREIEAGIHAALLNEKEPWKQVAPAEITWADGSTLKRRICIGTQGGLVMLWPRRRRGPYFSAGYENTASQVTQVKLKMPAEQEPLTPAQRYARRIRLRRDYLARNADKRAWNDLRAEFAAITDKQLAEIEAVDADSTYMMWSMAREFGWPQMEQHKTLTLKAARAPQHVIDGVAQAFGKGSFSYAWRYKYDYSVEGRFCADGIYRAWLSQEYKGCGNGHYWLLISPTQAIFYESD